MVRTVTDEKGEPWFCAKDLCDALGYKRADLAVKQHVNPHDAAKRCVWVEVGKKKDGTPAKRLTQMIFVNESGFYALVLGSKLPSALMFKDWVTSVVLPQIRKTGGYIPVNEVINVKVTLIVMQITFVTIYLFIFAATLPWVADY